MQNTQTYMEKKRISTLSNAIALAIMGTFAIQLILTLIIEVFCITANISMTDSIISSLLLIIVSVPSLTLPFILCFKFARLSLPDLMPLSAPKVSRFIPAVMMGIGVCGVANVLSQLLSYLLSLIGINVDMSVLMGSTEMTGPGFGFMIVAMAVTPALVEEFAFRGAIMQPLRRYGDGFAIVMSAILFGLMHGNLQQTPFAFVVGLALGFLAIRTETMWTAIAIHFLNNLTSCLASYFEAGMVDADILLFEGAVSVGMLLLGIIGFIIMYRQYGKELFRLAPNSSPLPDKGRTGAFLATPGMIILLIGFGLLIVLMTLATTLFPAGWVQQFS